MNLIECSKDCHYQSDGYCKLGTTAVIGEISDSECIHYTKLKPKKTKLESYKASSLSDI